MKANKIIIAIFALAITSCGTDPNGAKTFGGLTGKQWKNVGLDTAGSYIDEQRSPVTSAKTATDVTPKDAEFSWVNWGLSFVGL